MKIDDVDQDVARALISETFLETSRVGDDCCAVAMPAMYCTVATVTVMQPSFQAQPLRTPFSSEAAATRAATRACRVLAAAVVDYLC